MFSNWIVGLDLSAADDYIMKNVAQLAEIFDPKAIHFIYVTDKPDIPKDVLDDIPDLHLPDIMDYKSRIGDLIDQNLKRTGIATVHVKEGNPVTEILRLSDKLKNDLIILGHKSKKRQGVIHKKLLRKAPCSVLFIPEILKQGINSIVVPTDFSQHSSLAVDVGVSVAEKYNTQELHLLHVYQDATKYLGQVFETVHEVNQILDKRKEIDKKLTTYAKHQLSEYIAKFKNDSTALVPHISRIERGREIGGAGQQWVDQYEPDLVILGSKGENSAAATLLGSASEHMNENDTEHLMLVIKQKGENRSLLKILLGS